MKIKFTRRLIAIVTASLAALIGSACTSTKLTSHNAHECFANTQNNFSEVLSCYQKTQAQLPLAYQMIATDNTADIEKRSYQLTSQLWSPHNMVTPAIWSHRVDIIIPSNALNSRALLVINNGMRTAPTDPAPTNYDFSNDTLNTIAKKTRTVIVSIDNIPNQPLLYHGDEAAKSEDMSVAYSWQQFLNAPLANTFMPLQIPMMAAASRAMDLAEKELKPLKIKRFIATGISKRGWATWHTALVDTRVDAIVPFVFDALDFHKFMQHTYLSYGKNWPIALTPYYLAGIPEQQSNPAFEKLSQITDPIHYLQSAYASRLSIPKYLVNASGDDFFPADSARLYIDQLPGETSLRIIPNSDHGGIRKHTEQSLVSFINRQQQAQDLPKIVSKISPENGNNILSLTFSERPVQLIQWTATNASARDFRYACGLQYDPRPIDMPAEQTSPEGANTLLVVLPKPDTGWSASFVEARFADDMIATTPVYISPDDVYPASAPPTTGRACRTLPPRALP